MQGCPLHGTCSAGCWQHFGPAHGLPGCNRRCALPSLLCSLKGHGHWVNTMSLSTGGEGSLQGRAESVDFQEMLPARVWMQGFSMCHVSALLAVHMHASSPVCRPYVQTMRCAQAHSTTLAPLRQTQRLPRQQPSSGMMQRVAGGQSAWSQVLMACTPACVHLQAQCHVLCTRCSWPGIENNACLKLKEKSPIKRAGPEVLPCAVPNRRQRRLHALPLGAVHPEAAAGAHDGPHAADQPGEQIFSVRRRLSCAIASCTNSFCFCLKSFGPMLLRRSLFHLMAAGLSVPALTSRVSPGNARLSHCHAKGCCTDRHGPAWPGRRFGLCMASCVTCDQPPLHAPAINGVDACFAAAVKLWDGVKGTFVATFRGHVGPVYQV